MRKKLFTLFLALAVSAGTLFAESGTCGDNLTWDLTDGVLTISGTGAMEEYDLAANVPWYNYRFSINSVTINDGVTSISDYAFYDCSSLTSINVSTDNTNYCSIDGVLFDKERNVLIKCPGGRQGIYIIPNGVITIAYEAFYGCSGLSSVTIPNGVTSIGSYAFAGCNGLTSIEIPNSITNIEYGAFAYSFNLTSINVSTDNTNYSSIDGVLFSKDKATLVEYPGGKQGAYMIPSDVVNIQIGAFMYRVRLTSIEIPNSVLNIGEAAFMGCSGLNSITNYSTQPQTIDTYCFYDVNKSTCMLYVPAESIAAYQAADVWKEFTNILPIGESSDSCVIASGTCGAQGDNLTWTLTCDSVLTISGTGAMADYSYSEQIPQTPWNSYLSEIKSVVIEEGATNIGIWAFYECTGLTSVTIPNSVTSIGNKAFCNCSGLTSVTIPNSVTSIGSCAFENCTGLTSVTIPNSVTSIGIYAFMGCTGLTSVTIPNSVTSIGWGAFSDCTGLTSPVYNAHVFAYIPTSYSGAYTIPDGIESIAGVAFSGCSGLTSVTIPNSVTSIGWGAFRFCSGLTSVTIPNSVTSIEEDAFYGCTGLTSVTIPNSVTSIGYEAFYYCTALTSVTNYAETPQPINANVFSNVDLSACTLYVPAESVDAYKAADVWKEFGNILAIDDSTEEVNYATLLDIYNMAADSTFTLGAFDVMYVPDFQNGSNMYIKDSTGSCVIYKVNYGLQAGDHVEAGLQGKVHIYNGLYEITPISTKEELTVTSGEAPAPMEATEVPSLNNASQYVVYEGVSFTTDTAFVEGRRHTVYGSWNGQTITFYNQYHIGATLSADKTYNITAVNTIYRTTPQAYPLAVEEVASLPDSCIIASGTCGNRLTWELSCDSVLTISGTGAMTSYSSDTIVPWSSYRTSIASVVVGEGITRIANYSFQACENLRSVTLPTSVTGIRDFSFSGCTSLISIEIPNSVTRIGSNAFWDCDALTSIAIPYSVTNIRDQAFRGCNSLNSINVDSENPNYTSVDGVLFNKEATELIQYPAGKNNTSYSIPNSVTSIGAYAFYDCNNLTSVEIPNSVTLIGWGAFCGCEGLTSITVPNTVTSIGTTAFSYCYNLTTVTLPDSITSISMELFEYSNRLTSVIIPDGVTSIGYQAFLACSGLTSITIPNSVISIENYAFYGCRNLTAITNYAITPQTINTEVFSNFNKSTCTLYVPAQSVAAYQAADVWKDFGNILAIDSTEEAEVLSIAEAIQIGMALDSMATSAETYTIEGYVINAGTFYAGAKYQNWYMADDQETASSDFQAYKCYPIDGIDTVEVRNGSKVRMTGHLQKYYDRQKALYVVEMTYTPAIILSKPQIDTITVAEALALGAELEDNASTGKQYTIRGYVSSVSTPFSEQNLNQTFYIADDSLSTASSNEQGGFYVYRGKPTTGQAIREGALVELTTAIKNFNGRYIENAEQNVPVTVLQDGPECRVLSGTCGENLTWTFNNCDSVLTISGTGAMTDFASGNTTPWYSKRNSINTIVFDGGITSIGDDAFWSCDGLASVEIPNSIISIGNSAFSSCIGLTSVTIPNSVISIGSNAFGYCIGLTSIIVASDNSNYCDIDGVLFNKDKTKLIQYPGGKQGAYTIPNSVTSIGDYAFGHCIGLTSVTIPNSATNIGQYAFYDCTGLASIEIPNSITSIEREAFSGCSSLTSVTIPNSVTSIGNGAFSYCTGLTSVTIPNSVTSIGNGAFYECTSLTSLTNYTLQPQAINDIVFANVSLSACTLYVPAESVEAYQTADVWKEFGNILAIEGSENPDQEETGCIDYLNLNNAVCYVNNSLPDNTLTFNDFRAVQPVDYGSDQISSRHTVHLDRTETEPRTGGIAKTIPDGKFASIRLGNWDINAEAERIEYTFEVDTTRPILLIKYMPLLEAPGHDNSENPRFMIDLLINGQSLGRCSQIDINANDVLVGGNGDVKPEYAAQGWHKTPSDIAQTNGDIVWKEWSTVGINLSDPMYQGRSLTLRLTTYDCIFYGHSGYAYFTIGCSDGKLTSTESGSFTAPEGFEYRWMYKSSDQYRRPDGSVPEEYILSRDRQFEAGMLNDSLYVVDCMSLQDSTCYFTLETSLSGGSEGTDTVPCILASGTCGAEGDNLTWTLTCDSVLTISGTGAMADYTRSDGTISTPWFAYSNDIRSVVVSEGVTTIGNYAFAYFHRLTSVEIPNSVIALGDYIFYFNRELKTIEIPGSVVNMGEGVFFGCNSLTDVLIPNSVTNIGFVPFALCDKLTYIDVADDNLNYCSLDGVLYNKEKTILIQYPSKKGSSYIIPHQVTTIDSYAFYYRTDLTTVEIPSTVSLIKQEAFEACSNLNSIICKAEIPPTLERYVFDYVDKSACTLYVPAESLEAYKAAEVWKDFGTILPIEGDLPVGPTEGEFNVLYVGQDGDSISSEPVMLHLPVAPEIAGFTFLKWQVVAGDLENGIIIQAIYQANEYTSAPEVYTNPANPAQKLIRNGNVYILTDDKIYSITGQTVR